MELALVLVGAYVIGNFLTAPIVATLFYRQNIRVEGSGNPGARNAGRVLGKKAFVATFLGDALKGAIAVLAANWFGMDAWLQLLALSAAMIGHIYPVVNKFKGGQGVSTFIGGMLAIHPLAAVGFVAVFLVLYPIFKSFTVAGLSALALSPVYLFALSKDWGQALAACLPVGLLLLAHLNDLRMLHNQKRRVY